MCTYNYKTGKYEENDDLGQVMASTAKFVNVGSQEKMKSIHWNSILTETKKGETGGVHESGKSLLKKMTMAEVGQANRTRPDFTIRMLEGEPSIKKFANSSECTKEERDNILGLMDKIRENYEGKKDDKSSKKSESKSNADQEEANRKNMEEKMSGENKII